MKIVFLLPFLMLLSRSYGQKIDDSSVTQNATLSHLGEIQLTGGNRKRRPKIMEPKEPAISVPLSLCGDDYVGELTLGPSSEPFRVKYDSSLDVLMLFDKKLESDAQIVAHSKGQCGASPEFFEYSNRGNSVEVFKGGKGTLFTKTYPDGSKIEGSWLVTSRESLGLDPKANFEFVLADKVLGCGKGVQCDGHSAMRNTDSVVGLRFTRQKSGVFVPPVLRMMAEHYWFPTVSVYLSPLKEEGGKGSHITFGHYEQRDLIQGGKAGHQHLLAGFLDGKRDTKWELDLNEFVFSGKDGDVKYDGMVASIETAKPVVSLPTDLYNAIIRDTDAEVFEDKNDISARETLHAECYKVQEVLTGFYFRVVTVRDPNSKGVAYYLDGLDLSIEEQPRGEELEEKMCRLLIEDNGNNDATIGLGHPFLRKYYTSFRYPSTSAMEKKSPLLRKKIPEIVIGPSRAYAKWKHFFRTNKNEEYLANGLGDHSKMDKKEEKKKVKKKKAGGGNKKLGPLEEKMAQSNDEEGGK